MWVAWASTYLLIVAMKHWYVVLSFLAITLYNILVYNAGNFEKWLWISEKYFWLRKTLLWFIQSNYKEIDLGFGRKCIHIRTCESIIIKVSFLWFMKLKYSWVHNWDILCRNRSAEAHIHFCMWILGSHQKSWLTFFGNMRLCCNIVPLLIFHRPGDGWGDSLAEKNPFETLNISNNGNSDKGKLLFPNLFHCTSPKVSGFFF